LCDYLITFHWWWFIGINVGRETLDSINDPSNYNLYIQFPIKEEMKMFFFPFLFSKKKNQYHSQKQIFNTLCTNFHLIYFQLNWIEFLIELKFNTMKFTLNSIKLYAMPFNIFIQFKHNFHKINSFVSSIDH
jgi:hypothetical protein